MNDGADASVMQARENLKRKFTRSQTQIVQKRPSELIEEEKFDTPVKTKRNWVSITNKVDAKAMDRVNVNDDE